MSPIDYFLPHSFIVTSAILFGIILVRYFLVAGGLYFLLKWKSESWKNKKIEDKEPSPKVIRQEIFWSIITSLIFAVSGAWLVEQWRGGRTLIYNDISQYGWFYFFISIAILAFLHDTYFYFTHRLMHRPWLFNLMHRVHHNSRPPTAWAAFSFHPLEGIVEAVILPVLVFVVPVHYLALLTFLTLMTVTGVINHLGSELYPKHFADGKITRWIISATHHQMHHRTFNCNYGLYFTVWDRVLNTQNKDYENLFNSIKRRA